jgi:hypothetical protein
MLQNININKTSIPKITFGIIVLNGEPFTRYCLRSLYPFAHEIIVVEGGHVDAKSVCTPDGHSIDGTLNTLFRFKKEEDTENKLQIITKEGFWPKKDELGRDRTPQSRAYAERATGDYLWQVDIDEFYKFHDIKKVLELLINDPEITMISFPTYNFWGNIKYLMDSWALRRGLQNVHRLFKWSEKYYYLTHEPPTVLNESGQDLRQKRWIKAKEMKKKGIYMYHYSLLFPWQVEQKVKIYKDEKPESCSYMVQWAEDNYFKLGNPFMVHNYYHLPSWLERFHGKHPEQVICMMRDIKEGKVAEKLRKTDDVEELLDRNDYKIKRFLLKIGDHIDRFVFQLSRIKNIPKRIRKILLKYKL